jgi:integrase
MQLKLYRGKWCAVWWDGGTKRHSLGTSNREEAESEFEDFVRKRRAPLETVSEIWTAYVNEKGDPKKAHAYAWRFLSHHFASLRPDQVTRDRCKFYRASRKKTGVQDSTILRELGRLKAALRWHDPKTMAVFDMPPSGRPRERFITKAEAATLRDSAAAPHIRLFIILALSTAARMSALLELTWDRVDFDRGIITLALDGERRKGRATPKMNSQLHAALLEAYQVRGTSGYVIEYGAGPVKSVKRGFAFAAERAGLEDVTPHVLRHSAAVWMAEAGKSMSEIAKVLGHSDSRLTERVYAKFSPKYMEGVVEELVF